MLDSGRYERFQRNIIWFHHEFKSAEDHTPRSIEVQDVFSMVILNPTETRIDRFNQVCRDYRMEA